MPLRTFSLPDTLQDTTTPLPEMAYTVADSLGGAIVEVFTPVTRPAKDQSEYSTF